MDSRGDNIAAQISGVHDETNAAVGAIASVAATVEEKGAATAEIARNVEQAAQGTHPGLPRRSARRAA